MDNENNQVPVKSSGERKVIKLPRKKIIVGGIVLVVLVACWLILKMLTSTFGVGPTQLMEDQIPFIPGPGVRNENTAELMSINKGMGSQYYPDYYNSQPTIEDTREFLKMNYSSTIKTRKVKEVVTDVKNIVAGADGRVDSFNSSEKYGYISFIVAKSKFEDLRSQIENLTHKKLYTEDVSAENLLNQKQGIEEQTTNVLTTLDTLNIQLGNLSTAHTQSVSSINKQLTSIRSQLTSVRASIAVTSDTTILANLRYQESLLMGQESAQNTKLATENKNYNTQKQNLDNQIANWNNNLTNVNRQDTQFTNNIETVNGYVRVSWTSYWQMIKIFSPIHPTLIIIILIIIGWFSLRHKKFIPKVIME